MKLLNRTSYNYLILALPIVLVTMVFFYFIIRNFNGRHVDNTLKLEHTRIIKKSNQIENYYIEDELSDELLVKEISADSIIRDQYSTISIFDPIESQYEPFRQLLTNQKIAGKNYSLRIRKSLVENTTLLYSISILVFLLILFISLAFIILNRVLADKIWSPFKQILVSLENYQIGKSYKSLASTTIDEFKNLNQSIDTMTQRINKEYFVQKEFIDIISHEYQTPLSVIANEAEMLMQNQDLKEEDAIKINQILSYVQKLSKLNQNLLLLSRIDNSQFKKLEIVDINYLIDNLLEDRREQLKMKNIYFSFVQHAPCFQNTNSTLATILFRNFIQNAIRHNRKTDGVLNIEVFENRVEFSNTGIETALNTRFLFTKFYKTENSKNSIGLGLSIIKSICDHYGFELEYRFEKTASMHYFCVNFPSPIIR